MLPRTVHRLLFAIQRLPGHVSLHPQNRLYPLFATSIIEQLYPEHIPVIRQRDRRHPVGNRLLHQPGHTRRPVENRILRMYMKMRKCHIYT